MLWPEPRSVFDDLNPPEPLAAGHVGAHGGMTHSGDWMLMAHGMLNLVYDHQAGIVGTTALRSGMLMGMARRPIGNGALQFRAALSPDPVLASAAIHCSWRAARRGWRGASHRPAASARLLHGAFGVGLAECGLTEQHLPLRGLTGEPAFARRLSCTARRSWTRRGADQSPWLDSTHITFGVVTAGLVIDRFKIEMSRFNGREPTSMLEYRDGPAGFDGSAGLAESNVYAGYSG